MYPLPAKSPFESKIVTFAFRRVPDGEVAVGATIVSAVVEKALISGDDTGAAALVVADTPVIDTDGLSVLVLVATGTHGSSYALTCKAVADNGEKHQLTARLVVDNSAA